MWAGRGSHHSSGRRFKGQMGGLLVQTSPDRCTKDGVFGSRNNDKVTLWFRTILIRQQLGKGHLPQNYVCFGTCEFLLECIIVLFKKQRNQAGIQCVYKHKSLISVYNGKVILLCVGGR